MAFVVALFVLLILLKFRAQCPAPRWTLPSIWFFFINFIRLSHRSISVISGWKSIFRKWHKFNTWKDKNKMLWEREKNAPTTTIIATARPHIRMRLHTKLICFLFRFHVAWGVNKYIYILNGLRFDTQLNNIHNTYNEIVRMRSARTVLEIHQRSFV